MDLVIIRYLDESECTLFLCRTLMSPPTFPQIIPHAAAPTALTNSLSSRVSLNCDILD